MEPTTTSGARPEQQRLAFDGEPQAQEREHAKGAEPRVTPNPEVYQFEPADGSGNLTVLPSPRETTSPVWLQRTWLVIFVVFCVELGLLLAVLPWTQVWNSNSFLFSTAPGVRAVLQNNFVRGAVTGIGLVDIWLGIWEAVHYREKK